MNEKKMTLIVGNRLQNSIKSSSLVRIVDCPPKLLFHLHYTAQPAREDWVFYEPTIAVEEILVEN